MTCEQYQHCELAVRIGKLESQLRRQRRLLLVSGAVVMLIILGGWHSLKEYPSIEGSAFMLRDKMGDSRAVLTYDPQSYQGKLMFGRIDGNASNEKQIQWSPRLWIGQGTDGNPVIVFSDQHGVRRLSLGIRTGEFEGTKWESPYIELYDETGELCSDMSENGISIGSNGQHAVSLFSFPGSSGISVHAPEKYLSVSSSGVTINKPLEDGWEILKEWSVDPRGLGRKKW